jgi:hypothetical protein
MADAGSRSFYPSLKERCSSGYVSSVAVTPWNRAVGSHRNSNSDGQAAVSYPSPGTGVHSRGRCDGPGDLRHIGQLHPRPAPAAIELTEALRAE